MPFPSEPALPLGAVDEWVGELSLVVRAGGKPGDIEDGPGLVPDPDLSLGT